tara:strand:+ start:87 stop:527 length:441 start_codon:yes stop_codon:yes gene_type:complete
MDIKDAIQLTNKIFIYKSDASYYLLPETWRVVGADGKGDCEDHQLTVIWYYSNGNWFKWIWNVHFGPFRLWFCASPSGDGHLVTEVKSGVYKGMFFDNISKKLITRTQLDNAGYKLKMRHYFPLTAIKILIGYTLGSLGRFIRKRR